MEEERDGVTLLYHMAEWRARDIVRYPHSTAIET